MGKSIKIAAALMGALLLAACSTPRDFDDGAMIRALNANPAELATPKTVHFATTRCNHRPASAEPGTPKELLAKRCWDVALADQDMIRLGFGMAEDTTVYCGTASVAVTPDGAGEKAETTVTTPVFAECGADFRELRRAILATPCHCAMIFVHGFNTTFAFGLKRTAQLALDLSHEGVPILYSFAAAGRFDDYINDVEAAELSARALHRLLTALARDEAGNKPEIDVIAHSMGVRLALRAIGEGEPPDLRYVVLAAPDIDPAYFLRLAEKAAPRARRITVYTAKYDVAMSTSKAAHGGRPRLGEGLNPSAAQNLPRTEIIDATAHATDPYAHSYFAESKLVIDDIRAALRGTPAPQRKPLVCQATAVVACKIPCPEGADCSPTWYARFMRWLFG